MIHDDVADALPLFEIQFSIIRGVFQSLFDFTSNANVTYKKSNICWCA